MEFVCEVEITAASCPTIGIFSAIRCITVTQVSRHFSLVNASYLNLQHKPRLASEVLLLMIPMPWERVRMFDGTGSMHNISQRLDESSVVVVELVEQRFGCAGWFDQQQAQGGLYLC